MTGGKLESIDFDAFYGSGDFGVTADIAGSNVAGLFQKEEIDTDQFQGVAWTFRTNESHGENTTITIDSVEYTVQSILQLDSEEYLHILSKDGT